MANTTPQPAQFYLGVDGGGTKTLAVVVDVTGDELGRGVSGSANHQAVGAERAVEHIRAAVAVALAATGVTVSSLGQCAAGWFGIAGLDGPADYDLLLPYLRPLAEHVRLTNDAELPLAALPAGIGVALVAGTGSIALGRDIQGRVMRAGGWGHVLGDEGSGYDIGRQALQAATRAADGRAQLAGEGGATELLPLILRQWKLTSADELIPRVYRTSDATEKMQIAQLAPLVVHAAQSGDPVARHIVRHAAEELALAVNVVAEKLDCAADSLPLALGGGLLLGEPYLRLRVLRRIRQRLRIGSLALVSDPALCAARAAVNLPL